MKRDLPLQPELNVLAMRKGSEHYLFLYDDRSIEALLKIFDRYVALNDLSFNDFDRSVLTEKAQQQVQPLGNQGK